MAELTDIETARELVLAETSPMPAQEVKLDRARGRVLAADVTAEMAVPGFDNSAMDGYAVRFADLTGASADRPVELRIVDESRAGHPAGQGPRAGEAVVISTGAMVPEGADAVVRVEDTEREEETVRISVAPRPSQNLRRAGDDVRPGDVVLRAGITLGAAELGVAASVGRAALPCARRPQVELLSTGDELREPGEDLPPGGVVNSNAHSIRALAEAAGAEVTRTATIPDDRERTREMLGRSISGADIAVICGGVSVGPHDHVRPALESLGVRQVFWGVSLRPGKPTFFGIAPEGGLVFGLPGNPVSAMVTFGLFVRPAVRAMLGDPDPRLRTTAILDTAIEGQPGRAHAVRCTLRLDSDGWHAAATGEQGSHVLTSMVSADALAILPTATGRLEPGERVEVELLP
ncbi:molybdopterin molybdotransferase MoeA [Thermoleophilia bacterium SCSIO 60948]|nr:molybdopterin molybdotransferase MoeA [Thermoleophilia bacterium SCSIO 60948]